MAWLGMVRRGWVGQGMGRATSFAGVALSPSMGVVQHTPVVLAPPEHRWECSRCDHTAVTYEARHHSQFHSCAGLRGLTAPMTPAGERVKVSMIEREDFIADEVVTLDDEGRPAMAIEVEYEDHSDVSVFAPAAKVDLG